MTRSLARPSLHRAAALLVLGATLLTGCGGTEGAAPTMPTVTAYVSGGGSNRLAVQVPVVPSGIEASPRLPPLPASEQAQVLDTSWARLGVSARKKLCAQSAGAGARALAEQLPLSGTGALEESTVKEFLVGRCGRS